MFNSSLIIETSIQLNNGTFSYDCPLVNACQEMHLDIIRTELEMWKDQGQSDEGFIERFSDVFPKGFVRRDLKRAKNIMYDLFDIANSIVIRFELTPIYIYVMYHLIKEWFECWSDEDEIIYTPQSVIDYLNENKLEEDDYNIIISWFTSGTICTMDFAETYNGGDYVSTYFAEEVAAMYIEDGSNAFRLYALGVTIDNFFDLLPNDLRDLCITKFNNEKNKQSHENISLKIDETNTTVFISYSWDNDKHKLWVNTLAEKLINDNIHVIWDQNDLIPGDPLPQFMEQSIIQSDYVLIICTPKYKQKADMRKGGVGYEESIITSDILINQNHQKYITILASGTWETSTPIWAGGKYGIDLSDLDFEGMEFKKLINALSKRNK